MKNLTVYEGDSFNFYKEVVKNKRNPKDDDYFKTRLTAFNDVVKKRYEEYDDKYTRDELTNIDESVYPPQQRADLLQLYRFGSKAMVNLRVKLTTTKNKIVSDSCHNCTIGEISSFDHYLPKEKFPEFAVHPKNLVPSCTLCNSHKGSNWHIEGKRLFISPYLDTLPDLQFLFVKIIATEKDIDIAFTIDNRSGINEELYSIIESHYTRLFLCDRFVKNCASAIEETKTDMINYSQKLNLKDLLDIFIECASENRAKFGFNHFKYILLIALAQNDDFIHKYVGLP